jgi:Ran GTPase-activating protein (RanGAP) involved in mRNA processing and transport
MFEVYMPINYQDIASCESTTLDLSLQSFAEGGAATFAKAFKDNQSITRLMLSDTDITDEEFASIANGILERNIPLQLLDLDYNDLLTLKSLPILVTLIEKKLIEHLSLYRVNELVKNRDCHSQFSAMAEKGLIVVFNLNPLVKEKQYPTLFNPRPDRGLAQTMTNDKYEEERKEAAGSSIGKPGLTSS